VIPTSSAESAEGCSGTKQADHGETVLLVEDDPHVREFTRDVLRRGGYNVLAADSERQALWLWTRHSRQIDVLVTDMLIPHCSTGVELARKLQNSRAGLPVVYISGFGREIGEEDRAFSQRSPFLQKPFTPVALTKAVAASLATSRRRERAMR
jgi:CheY-like chemotaxis protein